MVRVTGHYLSVCLVALGLAFFSASVIAAESADIQDQWYHHGSYLGQYDCYGFDCARSVSDGFDEAISCPEGEREFTGFYTIPESPVVGDDYKLYFRYSCIVDGEDFGLASAVYDWSLTECPNIQPDGSCYKCYKDMQVTYTDYSSNPPHSFCTLGCVFQASGLSIGMSFTEPDPYWVVPALSTGQVCTESPSIPGSGDNYPPDSDGSCVAGGLGVTCLGAGTPAGCGDVNGEIVCPETVPDGNCTFFGNGNLICSGDAGSPPAPDNGTPGQPAAPDQTWQTHDPTTNTSGHVDIFGSGTVSGSSGPVTGGGDPTGAGVPGDSDGDGVPDNFPSEEGEGEGEGEGYGTVSGGLDCDSPPETDGGDPVQNALLYQQWRSRCPETPSEAAAIESAGLSGVPTDGSGLLNTSVDLTSSLDSSGFGLVGQCPVDLSLNLGPFGTVVVPVSEWCMLFQLLGNLIMIGAWYVALRMIVGVL